MTTRLREIAIPDFGSVEPSPSIPSETFVRRCEETYRKAAVDWLIIYGDREHYANLTFLTQVDPRFEEAILLLGPNNARILLAGNECLSYATISPLTGLDVRLCQSLSLLGQERGVAPRLTDALRDAGIGADNTIGLIGWKYLEPVEWPGAAMPFFVPDFLVRALGIIAPSAELSDKTSVLLHPESGLRSFVDADQIAIYEYAAVRASQMVWRMLSQTRPGDTEQNAAARMGYCGEPFAVHPMFSTAGVGDGPVTGLASPGHRRIAHGDGATTAIGLRGSLTARAGLVAQEDDAFEKLACDYFDGLLSWYAIVDLDVAGGEIHAAVTEALARGGLSSLLNPGHLTGDEEWSHSPVRPQSTDRLRSGMHIQVDIIPTPMRDGWALNCEDTVVLADTALRNSVRRRYPAVADRIDRRRRFMTDALGVSLCESILPLSSTPMCLPPFWLASDKLVCRN